MIKYCIIVVIIFLNSCTSPTEDTDYFFIGYDKPVIKGIVRTGEGSPEAIGIIGHPNEKRYISVSTNNSTSGIPNETSLRAPYPNPFNHSTNITFLLSQSGFVLCWIVQGKLDENNNDIKLLYSNSFLFDGSNLGVNKILISKKLSAGSYKLNLDATNFSNGVYRVYLKTNNGLLWRNLLIINN